MNELLATVLEQIRGVWRFRWLAMAAVWLVCLAGWLGVLWMPDRYEASARVFVDTRTTLSTVTQGLATESNLENQIARVRQALLGGPQLEGVAREAGLYTSGATPQERQNLVAKLRERVVISSSASTAGLYVISYTDANRELSLRVVDRLLNTFVEGALGGKREGSEQAQRFLVEQIQDYERRLSAAEERLANFKKQNVGLMPGAQGDYFSRLQAETDGVAKAQGLLTVAERRRDELERQLRGEQSSSAQRDSNSTLASAAGNATAVRIREAQARLDDLLLRFTDKHPDVIALRETIADLRARQQAEIEAVRRGDPSAVAQSGLSANPVFQNIQLQLNQTEVEIAALRTDMADRQRKVASLRQLVDTAPEVEAGFARLNRDYDVTRAQYGALVERLQRAKLAEEAEATGIVRFEVIDPPTASFKPVAPDRPRLILMVTAAAFAVGAGLAYLLHQLRPIFTSARQLTDMTGLPVLGVVSMTWLDRHKALARKGAMVYASVALVLVAVTAVVLALQGRATQLLHRLLA